MKETVLLDSGPLLAFLAEGSEHHEWVCEQWKRLNPPMLTCEAVLTEAASQLKLERHDTDPIFELLNRGVLRVGLEVENQLADLRSLMKRYRDRPMTLADACLVRLAELHPGAKVFTFDAEFLIYRRHGNMIIPVMMPARDAPSAKEDGFGRG